MRIAVALRYTCPECESLNLARSRRRGFVERWILWLIGLVPIRCLDCKARFYSLYRPPL